MRPQTLDEVIGQSHLLGEGECCFRQIVRRGEPVSFILWGPPGTGKTTLARIIAREVNAEFVELSAVTSGKKDVERVIEHARQNWNLGLGRFCLSMRSTALIRRSKMRFCRMLRAG
ncbi:AAA family ATPase [Candidatus Minimicrobia naudis]